ncbi:hypothetical protein [Burkholderia multivorans]|uniref:hypothetical protein n=1 Tax=Burkholderia multivorans TaxID=87883 RepID=UPI002019F2D4|nr:hypothetical protein [Burkholderia multivorans]MCO1381802.1 hypothetical protein [Burkholderia multivorans]MCO1401942.1 hypothetical protein [Burkholderia multivorans]UQO76351.1 hypothetical protein L0Z12_11055 [Burkholderia multivorans]
MSTKKFEEMVRKNPESFDYGDTPADRNLSERYFEQLMPEPFKKELSKRASSVGRRGRARSAPEST